MTMDKQDSRYPLKASLGFNGELFESWTGHYLLGKGYRGYSPLLLIFIQPDSWSPFGAGGINPYCYCVGDPVNYCDPTGHIKMRLLLPTPPKFFLVPKSAASRMMAQASGSNGSVVSRRRGAFGQSSGLDSPAQASGLLRSEAPLGLGSLRLSGTPASNPPALHPVERSPSLVPFEQALHPATSPSSVQQHASAGRIANPGEREVLIPGSSASLASGPSIQGNNGQSSMPPQPGTSRSSVNLTQVMRHTIRRNYGQEVSDQKTEKLLRDLLLRALRKKK